MSLANDLGDFFKGPVIIQAGPDEKGNNIVVNMRFPETVIGIIDDNGSEEITLTDGKTVRITSND